MSLTFDELNILGNLTNTTFGKGSTNHDDNVRSYTTQGSGNYSSAVTKSSLQGNKLSITALTIANLGPIHSQHQEITKCENELNQYIKTYIADIKKDFKKKENAGRNLKCTQVKDSERTDVEIINIYATTRQSYVRRTVIFEVE
jgi:hypothetical protein